MSSDRDPSLLAITDSTESLGGAWNSANTGTHAVTLPVQQPLRSDGSSLSNSLNPLRTELSSELIMNVLPTSIPDVLILEPRVFQDDRGFFLESYNERTLSEKAGITAHFVQDNHSRSTRNVLRGLHYQIQQPQGKLVRAIAGAILDVVVDLRKQSPTFGQWVSCVLSAENKRQFWVPEGLAHGFLVISDTAEVLYKATQYYAPQHERCLLWNDPDLAIEWSLTADPVLSVKDQAGQPFKAAELFV